MYDVFTHGETVSCPECPKEELTVVEKNYSGCSIDFGRCSKCGKAWQISFKVDEIKRIPDWDGPTREQVEAEKEAKEEEAEKKAKEERRNLYENLKKEFELK
jgi:hypothetical protein